MISSKCVVLIILLSMYIQTAKLQIQVSETTDVVPYQIAGIFEPAAATQQYAFDESMRNIHYDDFKVQPVIIQPTRTDSYSVWRELCKMKKIRPIAIFGPQNPISDRTIRDQCFIANIPHIQATWQPLDLDSAEIFATEQEKEIEEENEEENEGENEEENEEEPPSEPSFKKISINFYPDSAELSIALAKLLKFYSWEGFSILYEDNFGLMRIQKIMAEVSDKHQIIVRRLNPDASNHKIFKELNAYQESRIVIDCHVDRIQKYIAEANEQNMVNHYQHYIFVSMDTSTIAHKLISLPCNTTWLSLTEYDKLADSQHFLAPRVGKWNGPEPNYSTTVPQFEIESLLMADIANHLVKSLTKIRRPVSYICEQEGIPWGYGAKFQQRILQEQTTGVTGNIQFDDRGRRINYVLYVNEINSNKIGTTGSWESANGTTIITSSRHTSQVNQPSSKKFRIISRRNKPFFDYKPKCEGDDCEDDDPDMKFEGFAVDLTKHIFNFLRDEGYNYTYEFIHEEDKNYGKYDEKEKKWNGLIGDLLDKKADLAVCDFTITEERKKVIDFSVPFMSLGISILYKEEHPVKPAMFSFLNPYTFDVWLYTATAYCVVSIVLYLCARISPADWENPEPCDKDPEVLENIWFFKNCTWLTLGSIMTQGCDILPKAIGTRWVCAMWWFFAVIVCQTYIAQLSASMTSALEEEPINSVEDLAQQTKILYGAFDGGSTMEFFKTSKDKMYQQMYQVMKSNPAVLVDDSDEGERRVLEGKTKYAFFMESATIEYRLRRNCDLKKVGTELDSKDYGIAMPANSPFRTNINRAILKLKELTILDEIKKKWWNEKYGALQSCPQKKNENDVEGDLEMENLIGAFIVLIVGLVFSVFITAAEFTNEIRNIVIREQLSHKEAFIQELKASLNFFQMQKPVLRNPSRAPSVAPSLKSDSIKQEKKAELIQNFLEFEKEDALKKGDTLN